MNDDHRRFISGLLKLMPATSSRPFVCTGSPFDQGAFIVGYNAATALDRPFTSYWSDVTGFDRTGFDRDYQARRQALGKRRGTGNRPQIEALSAALGGSIETNVFSTPTERAHLLKRSERSSAAFEYLFRELRPSVVIIHSKTPISAFEQVSGCSVSLDEPTADRWQGHSFLLVGIPGPLWRRSREWALEFGEQLARRAGGQLSMSN